MPVFTHVTDGARWKTGEYRAPERPAYSVITILLVDGRRYFPRGENRPYLHPDGRILAMVLRRGAGKLSD